MKHTLVPRPSVAAWLLGLLALAPAAGCTNCDLVEAELRSRENDVAHLRSDLYRIECENQALQRELHALHGATVSAKPLPELAAQTYGVRQVVLGRQTGGYDEDDCPGDEALQVVIEPRDGDGHSLKAPGSLRVLVLQISTEGLKAPLSAWELSPQQLRPTWKSGLLGTGYYVILPWKAWPTSDRLRVVAQFTLPDGRLFEAEKDVTVRLPPPAYRKGLVAPAPTVDPGPELRVPETPNPRKFDRAPGVSQPGAVERPATGDAVQLLRPVGLR